MICLACRRFNRSSLCRDCLDDLRPASETVLEGALRVRPAFLHRGAARALVHNLKYRGIEPAGRFLAESMAPLVPPGAILVPMPRVLWRQLRHGIDPASVLAKHLEGLTGCRRVDLLIPPWFGASQARTSRSERRAPIYKASGPVDSPVVLVDDVITTGGTALSAWRALSPRAGLVVTATASAR